MAAKKNELQPFRQQSWVIPPQQSASFVDKMEQVLDVYERAYDPTNPVVCLDESPRQLTECRTFTDQNGKPNHDSEYIRHGVRDLYVCYEPLAGKRYVKVEENHNRFTWVKVVAALLDDAYKDCHKITLVQDNLTYRRTNLQLSMKCLPLPLQKPTWSG